MTTGVMKNGLTLAAIAAICTALVATTYQFTRARIEANEQAWLERSLAPALSGVFFEGNLTESKIVIPPPHGLPGRDDAIIYRVYAEQKPVAALFAVTAVDGYAGPIRVLIGITYEGVVSGVTILEHRETPGLGDRIASPRIDWAGQFTGRSLGDPELAGWFITGDGGQFDQLSGASVTPRAAIGAIRETLVYFDEHRDEIFSLPSPNTEETETET